jgi:hypothetical protein
LGEAGGFDQVANALLALFQCNEQAETVWFAQRTIAFGD